MTVEINRKIIVVMIYTIRNLVMIIMTPILYNNDSNG